MFFLKPLQFQFIIFGLSMLVYFEMDLHLHQDPSLILRVIGQVHVVVGLFATIKYVWRFAVLTGYRAMWDLECPST